MSSFLIQIFSQVIIKLVLTVVLAHLDHTGGNEYSGGAYLIEHAFILEGSIGRDSKHLLYNYLVLDTILFFLIYMI